MNKIQKELLALIYHDLDCIDKRELSKDNLYFYKLAKGNLKDLMKELNIQEYEDD